MISTPVSVSEHDDLQDADHQQLAAVLRDILSHFSRHQSTLKDAFFAHLRLIADSYRLSLLHSGQEALSNSHLALLTAYIDSPLSPHQEDVAESLAQMICYITDRLPLLPFPWFCPLYLAALETLLTHKTVSRQIPPALLHKLLPGRNDG